MRSLVYKHPTSKLNARDRLEYIWKDEDNENLKIAKNTNSKLRQDMGLKFPYFEGCKQ